LASPTSSKRRKAKKRKEEGGVNQHEADQWRGAIDERHREDGGSIGTKEAVSSGSGDPYLRRAPSAPLLREFEDVFLLGDVPQNMPKKTAGVMLAPLSRPQSSGSEGGTGEVDVLTSPSKPRKRPSSRQKRSGISKSSGKEKGNQRASKGSGSEREGDGAESKRGKIEDGQASSSMLADLPPPTSIAASPPLSSPTSSSLSQLPSPPPFPSDFSMPDLSFLGVPSSLEPYLLAEHNYSEDGKEKARGREVGAKRREEEVEEKGSVRSAHPSLHLDLTRMQSSRDKMVENIENDKDIEGGEGEGGRVEGVSEVVTALAGLSFLDSDSDPAPLITARKEKEEERKREGLGEQQQEKRKGGGIARSNGSGVQSPAHMSTAIDSDMKIEPLIFSSRLSTRGRAQNKKGKRHLMTLKERCFETVLVDVLPVFNHLLSTAMREDDTRLHNGEYAYVTTLSESIQDELLSFALANNILIPTIHLPLIYQRFTFYRKVKVRKGPNSGTTDLASRSSLSSLPSTSNTEEPRRDGGGEVDGVSGWALVMKEREEVTVPGWETVDEAFFVSFLRCCRGAWEKVSFSQCEHLTEQILDRLYSRNPGLRCLHVRGSPLLTLHALDSVLNTTSSTVEEVSFTYCSRFQSLPPFLSKLYLYCPRLQLLDLSFCRALTEKVVAHILSAYAVGFFPRLSVLRLRGIEQVASLSCLPHILLKYVMPSLDEVGQSSGGREGAVEKMAALFSLASRRALPKLDMSENPALRWHGVRCAMEVVGPVQKLRLKACRRLVVDESDDSDEERGEVQEGSEGAVASDAQESVPMHTATADESDVKLLRLENWRNLVMLRRMVSASGVSMTAISAYMHESGSELRQNMSVTAVHSCLTSFHVDHCSNLNVGCLLAPSLSQSSSAVSFRLPLTSVSLQHCSLSPSFSPAFLMWVKKGTSQLRKLRLPVMTKGADILRALSSSAFELVHLDMSGVEIENSEEKDDLQQALVQLALSLPLLHTIVLPTCFSNSAADMTELHRRMPMQQLL